MKIIYDKEKAIQAIKDINTQTPERNSRIEKSNRRLKCLCIILCIIAMVIVAAGAVAAPTIFPDFIKGYGEGFFYNLLVCILLVSLPLIANDIYWHNYEPLLDAEAYYSANAAFHNILQHYRVLKADGCSGDFLSYRIDLTLENAEHEVSHKRLNLIHVKEVERTDISETTIDLDTCTIFEPYR